MFLNTHVTNIKLKCHRS